MLRNISIRVRVLTLAVTLISLTIGIAWVGWHALEQVATAIAVSERENQEAQLFLQSEREISGAYSRVGAYMQTALDIDLQRFNLRRANADSDLEKAANLSGDPAARQATEESRAVVQAFLSSAEAIIQMRKALGQRAESIRQALAALAMPVKRDDKASVAKGVYVANAGDVRSSGPVQANPARRAPVPVARPPTLRENDAAAEADIGSPPDQKIATEPARSDELFGQAGEAALLVTLNPSDATLAAHAKAMQAVASVAPPSEAAARLLVLARDVAAPGREVLESYTKGEANQRGLFEKLQERRTRLVQHNQEVVQAALQTASSGTTQLMVIGGTALVLGGALAWLISRGIIVPLKAITDAITRLASGDGTVKIPEVASRNELGAMARAVNVFRQNFRELGNNARRTAISVGETKAAVVQVSDGARSQTVKLSQIAVALRESTGALKNVADNTKAASDKATRASELVKTGLLSVERLAAVVEVSAQSSRKVNQISQVIGLIANRTHILSLNAAIEAARAGEHGKGFVVVAQEVGKLAESAGQNAKLISEIVEQATDDASEGKAAADAARGAINGIALGADETTQMIHSSAAAIEEQQATITQIDENVTQLNAIAISNSSVADEIAATMAELSQMAEETSVKLAHFVA
jgi:methyl-accepting chemotaxis protein